MNFIKKPQNIVSPKKKRQKKNHYIVCHKKICGKKGDSMS